MKVERGKEFALWSEKPFLLKTKTDGFNVRVLFTYNIKY
jgi:hypothetical protein